MSNVQEGLKGVLPKDSENAISVVGNYSWGYSEKKTKASTVDFTNLKSLNFQIKKGEFVCIIGDVAAGKSSLLSCIIGDMIYLSNDDQLIL
jgi:ABC-type polysaccharide/polyol phosphate transport system ATPase subunit